MLILNRPFQTIDNINEFLKIKTNCSFTKKLKKVILNLNTKDKNQKLILEMFNAKKFIEANSEQFKEIESIARKIKKIR